jgi:hypothetical protein
MNKPTIDIGCANYGNVSPKWAGMLGNLMTSLPANNINFQRFFCANSMLADGNRNTAVQHFLDGTSDYLFFLDTDNVVTANDVERLLNTEKSLVSALYYTRERDPHPVAFTKSLEENAYTNIAGWTPGEILPVEQAGLGACLIRRDVFTDIRNTFVPFEFPGGGVLPIHKDNIAGEVRQAKIGLVPTEGSMPTYEYDPAKKTSARVSDGELHITVSTLRKGRSWPFFVTQYYRTEDMYFFEMAKEAGHQLWVDTGVEVKHGLGAESDGEDYRNYLKRTFDKVSRLVDHVEIETLEFHNGQVS